MMEKIGRAEWLQGLEALGDRFGWFDVLGDGYFLLHFETNPRTLLVTFEDVTRIRRSDPSGLPFGTRIADAWGWSALTLMSDEERWFRDPMIFETFDRLDREGFFERYERVIFYGAGPSNAYAAAAFSVVSPGATVVLIEPQATLDRTIAGWDNRFPDMRRTDFSGPYGYAPELTEAAQRVWLFYDPVQIFDSMHASLFRSEQTRLVPLPGTGGLCEEMLQGMGILGKILALAASGHLKPLSVYKLFRARRNFVPWLERFAGRLERKRRPLLTALAARSILRRQPSNHIEQMFTGAEKALNAQGRSLPHPLRANRPSRRQLRETPPRLGQSAGPSEASAS